MDQQLHTAQKERHVPSDALALSEETKKTPVSSFNLDSADSIPCEDETTKEISLVPTTSAKRGVDIQSPSPTTRLSNYPSSDSADGIPCEDQFTVTNSKNGGRDIRSRSPVKQTPHNSRGIPNISRSLMVGCAGKITTGKDPFYLDSGASDHATGNRKLISQMTTDKAGILLKMANGCYLWSHGCGYVITEDYTLANVHYVPGLDTNVVSVSQLNDLDYNLEFMRKECIIKDGRTGNLVGKGIRGVSGLFELDSLRVPLDRK